MYKELPDQLDRLALRVMPVLLASWAVLGPLALLGVWDPRDRWALSEMLVLSDLVGLLALLAMQE